MTTGLAQLGVEVRVETTDWDGPRRIPTPSGLVDGVPVRYHPGLLQRNYGFSPGLFRSVLGLAGQVDVVHCHGVWQMDVAWGLWAALLRRTPVVVTSHGSLMPWGMARRRRLKQLFLRSHARPMRRAWLHATSDEEASAIRALGYGPVFTVPIAVDTRWLRSPSEVDIRQELGLPADAVVVSTLCRFDPAKNLEALLDATQGLGVHLVIAGGGDGPYAREFRRRVEESGRTDVHLPGYLEGQGKAALLQQSNVYACSSLTENFGVAIVEALASGCPVVSTTGTPWTSLPESGAGVIVAPTSSGVRSGIQEVLRAGRTAEVQAAALALAARFAPQRCAKAMLDAYGALKEECRVNR